MDYRQKFKNLRIDNDLTQQDVANICGVSDATVGHWENGIRDMKIDSIVKLCYYYKVSADYILGIPKGFNYLKR
ncbi:MAG: helix-turn-helix domain-containing protein [Eubacterium sp.]